MNVMNFFRNNKTLLAIGISAFMGTAAIFGVPPKAGNLTNPPVVKLVRQVAPDGTGQAFKDAKEKAKEKAQEADLTGKAWSTAKWAGKLARDGLATAGAQKGYRWLRGRRKEGNANEATTGAKK